MDFSEQCKSLVVKQEPTFDSIHGPRPLSFKAYEPVICPALAERYDKSKIGNEKILFHGTLWENHDSIFTDGFLLKPGMKGHIGRGVYLADSLQQALYYQLKNEYTGLETEFRIIVCRVSLGLCTYRHKIQQNLDKATSDDSHWTFQNGNYKEYCVSDVSRVLPVGILVLSCDYENIQSKKRRRISKK